MRRRVATTICGSSIHSSVQLAPDRSCSWTSAWCMPESCVALKRASATSTSAIDRVALVRHGRRPAAAGERDLLAVQRHQRDVLAELAEAAGDQRQPVGEVREVVALALPLRRVAKAKPCGHRLAQRRALVAKLFQRARRAAELHDQQPRRLLRQPLRDAAPAAAATLRCGRRRGSGSPPACACSRSRPLPPKRAFMATKRADQLGELAVEALDDRLQAQHQRGVDDILAGAAEMNLSRHAARRRPRATGGPARARRGRRAPRRPAALPCLGRTTPAPRRWRRLQPVR